MKAYRLGNGTQMCKGNMLNVQQDMSALMGTPKELANADELVLPLAPGKLPMLILLKSNQKVNRHNTAQFIELKVNRVTILRWPIFLEENNPL